jgi:hypothetical protein
LLRDRDGGLWVGTYGFGLAHIYRGRVDTFSEADGLSGGFVSKVFEDREGNIWAGTMNGFDRFREYAVPNVSVKQGLSIGVAVSLLAANDGSIWIATSGGFNVWKNGYISFAGARFGSVRAGDRLNSSPPASLFQDSTGRIWIATRSGFGYSEENSRRGGGKGAAIGAGVGAGAGAGSEIITKGEQVKVPSETLLEFTLQQSVSIPTRRR